MNTYKFLILIIILATTLLYANERVKYNFNPEWKLLIGDPKGAEKVNYDDSN
jgi:hypothetical protein